MTAPLDLTDFGDLALMAVAAVGVHPRVLIDPADALALYNEVKRLTSEITGLVGAFQSQQRDLNDLRDERDEARAALRELVRLKAIKDDLTLTEIDDPQVRDYERSKPAAWAEARRIVG